MPPWKRALERFAPITIAGVLPTVVLCIGIAIYTLNHFFNHAPYLLDSGWYSDIVYRAGIFPRNPRLACDYAEWYFGVHFSPMISVFSLLSYVQPLPRIEWYALHQALMFMPFGMATYLLASRVDRPGLLRRLPVTAFAAIAFTFNGQILKMIPYPHYEVAIGGLICLMLGALVTDRPRMAWAFLILTIAVREDGGIHAGLALAPFLYLSWRGATLPVSRRTMIKMIGVAMVSSVFGIFCQKILFDGASVMSIVYLGNPIYSHLSSQVLVDRFWDFYENCQVMFYPFLATCVLAAVRRDARYLLGWAVTIPWFVLNFLASQPQKATFAAYAGFPFVASVFWVYVYGAKLAPEARRLRPIVLEAVFAGICLLATFGMHRAWPAMGKFMEKEVFYLRPSDRAAVHEFVDILGKRRGELGRFHADYSAAAIALESLGDDNGWAPKIPASDAIAFHSESVYRDHLLPDLFTHQLDFCTRIKRTGIVLCTRNRLPAGFFGGLATDVIPSSFVFANSLRRRGIAVEPRGVTLTGRVGFDAYLGLLPAGRYELVWTLATEGPAADATDLIHMRIMVGTEERATVTSRVGDTTLSVPFESKGEELLWFRSESRFPATIVITGASVRQQP
ncbi:MAG TPA: hypothetical protein VIU61_07095 [Kofleriaceae bacterium]